jgi:hypothetical protein
MSRQQYHSRACFDRLLIEPALLAQAVLIAFLLIRSAAANDLSSTVDYRSQIKPLLEEKCYSCHGVLRQEAGLRLETRDLMTEHDVIVPGDPDGSLLIERITVEGSERMPPPHDGAPLQPDQITLLVRWIRSGAIAPEEQPPPAPQEHWAFQPIVRPVSLDADSSDEPPLALSSHPIDRLLRAKQRDQSLQTVGPAERSILIRRLYLDLIGLPPTSEQLRDERPWNRIVDDLLASPHYGERWGRHWMDVWRYSDWYGLGKQLRYSQKHLWHWRDWIVRSLNRDKGYDRMILEMLAGDELDPTNIDSVAGTGYLARNYYLFNRTTWLDHTIEHTGKAFLGLTLNCAKCHDHKYDPISQRDYYRFRAIFEPHQVRLDPLPSENTAEVLDFEKDGLPRVFDDHVNLPTYLHVRGDPKNPDTSDPLEPGVPEILSEFAEPIRPVDLPAKAYAPGTRPYVQRAHLRQAQNKLEAAKNALAAARQRLDEFQPPPEPSADASDLDFHIHDAFDQPNQALWELVGKDWQYRDGTLLRDTPTREPEMIRLRKDLPDNFDLRCKYTTTGGATYKSVTFRFDQSEDNQDANYVYTSAHAPGPKVQAAYTRNGKNIYPADGRKPFALSVGKTYEIRIAVRETLVNVWIDDQFQLAYRFPDRRDGFFSMSGFDATVAFDEIEITSLPPSVDLKPAGQAAPTSKETLQRAVQLAEAKWTAAESNHRSIKATIDADNARFHDEGDAVEQAFLAARAQLQLRVDEASVAVLAAGSDAKQAKSAEKQLAAAQDTLAKLTRENATYESLRGAKKALESPAHKEADYPPTFASTSTGRRLALAKWIASPRNPLTARVAVNHVWMRHFGTPLVESVFDFGLRAEKPLHSDVLDYLAAEFIDSGWSFKHLHRLIVSSETYRLRSSQKDAAPETRRLDPENRFYWRANQRRMESQVVRDSLLKLGGELDLTHGGPSLDANKNSKRRSIYLKHSRDDQEKFLAMFDDADIMRCYRRSESIVPQQALALSNSKLAFEMSNRLASRFEHHADDAFCRDVWFECLGRPISEAEHSVCREFLLEANELPTLQSLEPDQRRQRSRARLVHAILNHNDFVTIR